MAVYMFNLIDVSKIFLFAFIFTRMIHFSSQDASLLLQDVTEDVFGTNAAILPVAFGDFNSDRFTDIFVVNVPDGDKLSVMLAKPQTFGSSQKTYFHLDARQSGLSCSVIDNGYLVSAQPGDFDGDGGMDVAVVVQHLNSHQLFSFVLWGIHLMVNENQHRLVCPMESIEQNWHHKINMNMQPLVLDLNGDGTTDLFGLDANNTVGFWVFAKGSRTAQPQFHALHGGNLPNVDRANAFIDLNADGNADLFVTSKSHFEVWLNKAGFKDPPIKIELPTCGGKDELINCSGHAVFSDINLNGRIDVILPVCYDVLCSNSSLLSSPADMFLRSNQTLKPLFLELGDWQFDLEQNSETNGIVYPPLMPRFGDVNLDGYPDILIRMKNSKTGVRQTQLLLNVGVESLEVRGFVVQPTYTEGAMCSEMATFYDLNEDGVNDLIVVGRQAKNSNQLRIGAYKNVTHISDAYFLKVLVLSGVCYFTCANDQINVPYGTNYNGQTICYRTKRSEIYFSSDMVTSCASQLSQTSHTSLQLPYTLFGLALEANFIDYLYINVTNGSLPVAKSHYWTQIIPNSQLYIIPFPTQHPNLWSIKLYVTSSKAVTLTAIVLLGICGFISFVIVLLHLRDRRKDKREQQMITNRFHFDAM